MCVRARFSALRGRGTHPESCSLRGRKARCENLQLRMTLICSRTSTSDWQQVTMRITSSEYRLSLLRFSAHRDANGVEWWQRCQVATMQRQRLLRPAARARAR
eukprot:2021511-Pleurochrysis_carterae.AAC.1